MGFLDTIKSLFGGGASNAADEAARFATQQQFGGQQAEPQQQFQAQEDAPDSGASGGGTFDTAGFDPMNDEESYFEAEVIMESEGFGGGTDESRAEVMARYGIQNRSPHWHIVKESVWQVLAQKHGSFDEAAQRMANFRSNRAMQQMQQKQQSTVASGALKPVEGISLEKWAAINAAIVQGNGLDDLLKGNGIDRARWDRARAEWESRMSTDTTFAVATVYGQAFQAASQSKYTALAKEANAARAANQDPTSQPPMDVLSYFRLLFEQEAASRHGVDPQAAIKAQGLTIVDWIDLSTFMGYYIERNHQRLLQNELKQLDNLRAEVIAKYPGLSPADLDIQF